MDIVHGSRMSYIPISLTHRGSGIAFKTLFRGTENTPENHWFSVARQNDFYSPVHKHNFDQFRFALSGDVSIRPDMVIKPGQICYHPEGVEYGPQQDGPGDREVLVLQFGGASGQGFLSESQLRETNQELSKVGKFEGGKYYQGDSVKDGFEALYEHSQGRKLVYPRGRYHSPVLMDPDAFNWKKHAGSTTTGNAYRKHLGSFSEREVVVQMWKLEDGAELQTVVQDAVEFLFVLRGAGKVFHEDKANGEQWEKGSAVRLQPGKSVIFTAAVETEILHIVVPTISK